MQFSGKYPTFVSRDVFYLCRCILPYAYRICFFGYFLCDFSYLAHPFQRPRLGMEKNPRVEPRHPTSHRFFMAFSGDDCRRSRLLSVYRPAFPCVRETGRNQPPQFLPQVSFRPHHRSRYRFRSCRPRNAHRVYRGIGPFPFPQPPRQNPFKTHEAQRWRLNVFMYDINLKRRFLFVSIFCLCRKPHFCLKSQYLLVIVAYKQVNIPAFFPIVGSRTKQVNGGSVPEMFLRQFIYRIYFKFV